MIESIARGRVAAAAGDQHIEILPRRPIRPERMPVAPEIAAIAFAADFRGVEVGNGKGVDPLLVLPGDCAVLGCRFFQRRLPGWPVGRITTPRRWRRTFACALPHLPAIGPLSSMHRRVGTCCATDATAKLVGRACQPGMPVGPAPCHNSIRPRFRAGRAAGRYARSKRERGSRSELYAVCAMGVAARDGVHRVRIPVCERADGCPPAVHQSENDGVSEATSSDLIASSKPERREHVPLGILYMIGATIVFAASSAVSKWLVASYPIGEVLFTRTAVALITCALFILPQTGLAVFRTQRLRHHVGRSLSQ